MKQAYEELRMDVIITSTPDENEGPLNPDF